MNERIYHSKLQKSGLSISLDECKKHEKNIKGIPNYGMFKSFADESFRMIDDDKDGNKSDSKKKIVLKVIATILTLFMMKK